MTSIRRFLDEIDKIKKGYRIIYCIDKQYMYLQCIQAVVTAVIPFIGIYFIGQIITELTKESDIQHIVKLIVCTLVLEMIFAFMKEIVNAKISCHSNQWQAKMEIFFSKVNHQMLFHCLEDSEVKLLKNKIKINQNATGAGLDVLISQINVVINHLFTLICSVILCIEIFFIKHYHENASIIYDIIMSKLLFVFIIVVIIICSYYINIYNKRENIEECREWSKLPESNRILNYYHSSINDNLGAMDIRIYHQDDIIMKEIDKWTDNPVYINKISQIHSYYGRKKAFLTIIIDLVISLYIGIKVFVGIYEIGKYIQYTGSIMKFISAISGLCSVGTKYLSNNKYLEDVFQYVDMPKEEEGGSQDILFELEKEHIFEFRNVSFRYSDSGEYVLQNVSLKILSSKKIAIIGENGSGKTTFIKLLCGLYKPEQGEILFDGVNINLIKREKYFELFSVIFQDFYLFSFSLGQNIACDIHFDKKKVEECIEKVGFKERYLEFEEKLDTNLFKDFDISGVEISGGEAQKIAIARALYKDAPIIIMDEPTSALDPIAEEEIFEKVKTFKENKTLIFISHRLYSCQFCDEIIVFDKGNILQRGTHSELLSDRNGKYYNLWNSQAKHYFDDENR